MPVFCENLTDNQKLEGARRLLISCGWKVEAPLPSFSKIDCMGNF